MTADLTELSRLLSQAADHIAEVGHVKGEFYAHMYDPTSTTPTGQRPVCTAGAIAWAHNGVPIPLPGDTVFADAIRFVSGHLPGDIPVDSESLQPDHIEHVASWNDDEDRTVDQVVSMLRLCSRDALECQLLCQHIAEYDDHEAHDWGPDELNAYKAELAKLRWGAAA